MTPLLAAPASSRGLVVGSTWSKDQGLDFEHQKSSLSWRDCRREGRASTGFPCFSCNNLPGWRVPLLQSMHKNAMLQLFLQGASSPTVTVLVLYVCLAVCRVANVSGVGFHVLFDLGMSACFFHFFPPRV